MSEKVLLILCDGLRPEAAESCGHPFKERLFKEWCYSGGARTVFPSITLPCHMSLIHSQSPDEHGISSNIFSPSSERHGLFEQLRDFKKTSAFFYSWGELRDLCAPSSLSYSNFISSVVFGGERAGEILAENATAFIYERSPDFAFLYLENTDIAGHEFGWGSKEYQEAVSFSFGLIDRVISKLPTDYAVFITADHGGHDFTHGTELSCDMTIPIFVKSKRAIDDEKFSKAGIVDISPSICDLLEIPPAKSFRGESFFRK